mgnify:CR=1 FL=1
MDIDVSLILKKPGASMSFDVTGVVEDLDVPGGATPSSGPFSVKGVATSIGSGVYVEANATGSVKLICSRCLSPFDLKMDLSCEAKFVPEAQAAAEARDEDVEVFALSDSRCDLDEMLRHEIVLNVPMKPLCREDCKGICPVCGKNLNEGDCDCPKDGAQPTLFGRKLLDALEERGNKRGRP